MIILNGLAEIAPNDTGAAIHLIILAAGIMAFAAYVAFRKR